MADLLYDDTYTGPRYRYGLKYRPVTVANLPKGWIVQSGKKHPDFRLFGTVDFPRQLTEDEVVAFDLEDIGRVEMSKNPTPRGSRSTFPMPHCTLHGLPAFMRGDGEWYHIWTPDEDIYDRCSKDFEPQELKTKRMSKNPKRNPVLTSKPREGRSESPFTGKVDTLTPGRTGYEGQAKLGQTFVHEEVEKGEAKFTRGGGAVLRNPLSKRHRHEHVHTRGMRDAHEGKIYGYLHGHPHRHLRKHGRSKIGSQVIRHSHQHNSKNPDEAPFFIDKSGFYPNNSKAGNPGEAPFFKDTSGFYPTGNPRASKGKDRVILRRWTKADSIGLPEYEDIIALFVDTYDSRTGMVSAYEHVGQHGDASYSAVVQKTKPVSASAQDAKDLLKELRKIGYKPEVIQRFSPPRGNPAAATPAAFKDKSGFYQNARTGKAYGGASQYDQRNVFPLANPHSVNLSKALCPNCNMGILVPEGAGAVECPGCKSTANVGA